MKLPRRLHFIIVTLLTVFALALVGLAIVAYAKDRLNKTLIQRYTEQEGVVALQIAQTAIDDIQTSHSFLGTLAEMPEIASGDSDSCEKRLGSIKKLFPQHIDRISRLNDKGIITCSTESHLVGLNAIIFDKSTTEIISDPDHNPIIGSLTIPPGSDEYSIGYYFPLRNASGAFVGMLKAVTFVSTIRGQYEKNPAFHYTGQPILIDHRGDIIYSSDQDLLNQNLTRDEIDSDIIEQNTLQHILRLASKNQQGVISYIIDNKDHFATYRRIDILPGHWWVLIFATNDETVETAFLADVNRLIKALAIGNMTLVLIILCAYVCYTLRHLIRPETVISSRHEKHMKRNITDINRAFIKVSQKLGKLEEHLEYDINALHNEADKRGVPKSGN